MDTTEALVDVPGLGSVIVDLDTHHFGLTADSVTMLNGVFWPDGQLATCEDHEKTAAHLEALGIL